MGRRQTFNTAIAACMELLNHTGKSTASVEVKYAALESVVRMLTPIIPHVAQEMWEGLGHQGQVLDVEWPQLDESALTQDTIEMVIQVNGKVRAKISVAADANVDEIKALALADQNAQRFIDGKEIRKEIVVPGKLINIVVG